MDDVGQHRDEHDAEGWVMGVMAGLGRWAIVVVVVCGVGVAGCSKKQTAATQARSAAASAGAVAASDEPAPEDAEAESLVEPVPKTKTDRLIAAAEKSASLCEAWKTVDKLEQPDPQDMKEVVEYVDKAYHAYLRIDPTRKVRERVPAVRGRAATVRDIELPDEVQADIDTVRQALFAYWVRVSTFEEWVRVGKIDKAGYDRRMQAAFAKLTGDDVTQAQQRLMDFESTHCHI